MSPKGQNSKARLSGSSSGGLDALIRAAKLDSGGSERPVEKWDPPYCGGIGLEIRKDGTWLYQGSPIGRMALVKLFASILRKDDDGRTYLVTPVEKVDVKVEDAPFLAVELAVEGAGEDQQLTFRTNVDDVVTIDRDHPVHFVAQMPDGGLKPYITVRGRLEVLVNRACYMDMLNLAESSKDDGRPGIWSGGIWWPLVCDQPS